MQYAQSIKKINIKIYSRFLQDIATFLTENLKTLKDLKVGRVFVGN